MGRGAASRPKTVSKTGSDCRPHAIFYFFILNVNLTFLIEGNCVINLDFPRSDNIKKILSSNKKALFSNLVNNLNVANVKYMEVN